MAAGVGAAICWWQGDIRPARQLTFYFVVFFANTSSFLYATTRGKFLEWDRILDNLHLRGNEDVLDLGCGRGAVLTAVARRLATGRVTVRDFRELDVEDLLGRDTVPPDTELLLCQHLCDVSKHQCYARFDRGKSIGKKNGFTCHGGTSNPPYICLTMYPVKYSSFVFNPI